ncbi:conserved hypothetical protein [Xanthomonas citri pv. fuscans]|nr:conserved hypothetical protein [Xanthomonas citri pv. fuscans]
MDGQLQCNRQIKRSRACFMRRQSADARPPSALRAPSPAGAGRDPGDGQLQYTLKIKRTQAFLLPLAGEGGAQRRMSADARPPSALRAPSPAGAGREPGDGQLQYTLKIKRTQAFLLPLAGEGGAQRRMRATPSQPA